MPETIKRKLIEVALPLEAINKESGREKSIRHGHPSTLHQWWARRPLAACRSVLFASLVDDPSARPDEFPTEQEQEVERERLFKLIERLAEWEQCNDPGLLEAVRTEIKRSCKGELPTVLDPFCGGGSIPLEAQRLGLSVCASDLNPIPVLITRAMIEYPARFAGRRPLLSVGDKKLFEQDWNGSTGLVKDVRDYGDWMRAEAEKRIGHLYPKVKVPKDLGGGDATAIAWLWTRTVKCPNPACGGIMPLARSFFLFTKKGSQVWVDVKINHSDKSIAFVVRNDVGVPREGTVDRRGAVCVFCSVPVPFDHIRAEGRAGRIGSKLMAIVAETKKGRIYVSPTSEQESAAVESKANNVPESDLPEQALGFRVQLYGMTSHKDLFTSRQLAALTTFSDIVGEVREKVIKEALSRGEKDDGIPLHSGGAGVTAYADAIATYLAFAIDKGANLWSSVCSWMSDRGAMRETFARQAVSMVWDYAEANPFSNSGGNISMFVDRIADTIEGLPHEASSTKVIQHDAMMKFEHPTKVVISTDPPYYDNIGYADLSDFFYVWLRRSIGKLYPDLFSTVLVPKEQELVATPFRFGGSKEKARIFFETGLGKTFSWMREVQCPDYPLTVYYAFKQSETDDDDDGSADVSIKNGGKTGSTGWETMLEGLIQASFEITGTWPMRTESAGRARARGSNALASSILLVCRPRPTSASRATRRELITCLKKELPSALRTLQQGSIAPVDLAQAAIGPGMAAFSRYSEILEADGSRMTVRSGLELINQILDEVLSEQDGDYDSDTRWAISWFDQHGFSEGQFGVAEVLSKAKDTALAGLVEAGIVNCKGGKVKLYQRSELSADWDPATDSRLTVWELTHYLIRALEDGGIIKAANLMQEIGSKAETAQELAYRLYGICERKKWSQEALAYNSLVVSWPEIKAAAVGLGQGSKQLQTSEI
jgi:putative DNA methylase